MKKYLKEYCVGCGLCEVFNEAECIVNKKGYKTPMSGDESFLESVCPCAGKQLDKMDLSELWGKTEACYYGWSTNDDLRQHASSGGVLTEIAAYMLEYHLADAVLHTCVDPNNPTKTIACQSVSREDLSSRCGSRYSISHPLSIISEIDRSKKYVFIGKPCDVAALTNYMEVDDEIKACIVLTMSFFCAGLPSQDAQQQLLKKLGCSEIEVTSLRYRGDGWPGYTVAKDRADREYRTDYVASWGETLGRDIMKMCRFCLDGIGEMADISCGDAWYLTEDRKPDFSEGKGRNVIFCRTELGKEILEETVAFGNVAITSAGVENLRYIQTYQWDRRATMIDKMLAMRLFGRAVPKYKLVQIIHYAKGVNIKRHFAIFRGTVKRILQKKI